MGRSVNKVTLIGFLGSAPEVRYMPNGNAVANITLATDESYTEKQTGQKVEQTEWHRLVVYGKLAEICDQYLKKGSKAYFEGRLKTREWEKDGIKRYTTEIVVNDMMMLDGASGHSSAQPAYQAPQQPVTHGGYSQAPAQPAYQSPQQPVTHGGYSQAPAQPAYQSPQQPVTHGGYSQAPAQPAYQSPQQPVTHGEYPQAPAQPAYQSPQQPVTHGEYPQAPAQPTHQRAGK